MFLSEELYVVVFEQKIDTEAELETIEKDFAYLQGGKVQVRQNGELSKAIIDLFTSGGEYIILGASQSHITCIKSSEITKFMDLNQNLMPPSVRVRLEYYKKLNFVQ